MSEACGRACYARQGRFRTRVVSDRLAWNLAQSRRGDFAGLMAREVRRKGCLVVRVHSAGDFYDAEYAAKWEWVTRHSPRARFYFYTRSWRVDDIRPVLARMACLGNVRAWYSADADTGPPPDVPPGVRVAYLQTREGEGAGGADLVFRVRGLRKGRLGLGLVCPSETPQGKAQDVTCGSCQRCWR